MGDVNWLLGLFPGGKLAGILGGLVAALAGVWALLARERKAGRDAQKVDEYERHLQELERIKRAGSADAAGSVHDDPHNRDNVRS